MILKNLTVLTSLLLVSLMPVKAQNTSPFPDVPANHWASAAIVDLHKMGILVGYPKEYDNSTAQVCWKSLLKAMERGNEKVVRLLMSDESWKTLTEQRGNYKTLSALLRRTANKIRRHEREGFTEWRSIEPSEEGKTASIVVRLYHGSSDLVFSFQKEKEGWRVSSIYSIY